MIPDSFWTPMVCLAVIAGIFTLGELLSVLLKGAVSGLILATCIFMAGFWSGILPADIAARTGLVALMRGVGTALVITNLGTTINLENICREWKTVVVALSGFIGISIACFTVGSWLFGREYALVAAPPISGGSVAGVLVQTAAMDAGFPELAGFAVLVLACQKFFGMPVTTLCLRREMANRLAAGDFDEDGKIYADSRPIHLPGMRLIPEIPKAYLSTNMIFAGLAITAAVAYLVGNATKIPGSDPVNYYLNPNIAYLLFGLLATRIGFLPQQSLKNAQSNGLLSFGLRCLIPGSMASISPALLLEMLPKIAGLLGMSTLFIALVCYLFGRMVGYSPYISIACGCSCMMGYPATELITYEIVDNMKSASDEQRARATEYLMPKMIVSGFTTVTMASVVFASLIAPIIFR